MFEKSRKVNFVHQKLILFFVYQTVVVFQKTHMSINKLSFYRLWAPQCLKCCRRRFVFDFLCLCDIFWALGPKTNSKTFKLEFWIRVEPVIADFRGFRSDLDRFGIFF